MHDNLPKLQMYCCLCRWLWVKQRRQTLRPNRQNLICPDHQTEPQRGGEQPGSSVQGCVCIVCIVRCFFKVCCAGVCYILCAKSGWQCIVTVSEHIVSVFCGCQMWTSPCGAAHTMHCAIWISWAAGCQIQSTSETPQCGNSKCNLYQSQLTIKSRALRNISMGT